MMARVRELRVICNDSQKVERAKSWRAESCKRTYLIGENMLIAVSFAPSRSRRIAVDILPAVWQRYIVY